MLPTVTCEELVSPFSFYFEDQIHRGMTHRKKLYFQVQTYSKTQRDKAYELALHLSQQGILSVITASSVMRPTCYRVWVDLSAAKAVGNMQAVAETA